MERCVAPSTVEPQASVQSGCSFQTIEFTSSPPKKTRRIIEVPRLSPRNTIHKWILESTTPHPRIPSHKWRVDIFGGEFPGVSLKNVSFQPSQIVVFGRIHGKKMLLKLLGFHLWWWRLPGIAHTTTISTTRPRGRFGEVFFGGFGVREFQKKMAGKKWEDTNG